MFTNPTAPPPKKDEDPVVAPDPAASVKPDQAEVEGEWKSGDAWHK